MARILLLLLLMALIASLPFANNWLSKNKDGTLYDEVYINGIIERYVDNHPDYIISSLRKYSLLQEEESRRSFINNAVLENKDEVYDTSYPTVGKGVVKIVEFFDYACGYCKKVSSFVEQVLKDGGDDLQYTFRELAMFSPGSEFVSKAGLAVNLIAPNKYFDFYKSAISFEGNYTEDSLRKIVGDLGIDIQEFEKAWASEEVSNMLSDSFALFQKLALNGTPAFIVCDNPVVGADLEGVKKAIDECKKHNNASK